ncbi:MAG TPA: UDP-N-acetylglucosamine 1-carboxyvinyltransferase [Polyangiaceae bacterium]|nr:UDP-N-acetylglucosamine 1-carboxyvinyltransferase [Polyangiaceae bacterium]
MNSLLIEGGHPIAGEIQIAGNKNAALPMLAAALLTDQPVFFRRVPEIRDVLTMQATLSELGVDVSREDGGRVTCRAGRLTTTTPSPALCQKTRASFLLAGPLLAREGRAELPSPGGDKIGRRPVDTHIEALRELGAEVEIRPDRYVMRAPNGLVGRDLFLGEMSVMATENVLMAATLAKGTTVIRNAASEPHVQDLCRMLVSMGARIEGIGSNTLTIEGQPKLSGCTAEVGPDYLEVGSFIALAAMTGGQLWIRGACPSQHRVTANAFGKLGVRFESHGDDIFVPRHSELRVEEGLHGALPKIHDAPWPGFPADLTSIALVLATQAQGTTLIHEWMYESRLYWVDRLIAMGARVTLCDPHRAIVIGPAKLYAQNVSSPDIRAGMALVIAALVAEGKSTIHNAQQIDRGYERIEDRLRAIGARIERVEARKS